MFAGPCSLILTVAVHEEPCFVLTETLGQESTCAPHFSEVVAPAGPMKMRKKLAWSLVTAVVLLGIGAIVGWRLITLRIRANERAPHLEVVDRQAVDFAFKTLDGKPNVSPPSKERRFS